MTDARSTGRARRRGVGSRSIPDDVLAWFEGTGPMPWAGVLPDEEESVLRWWRAYAGDNPEAQPPVEDAPWIDWNNEELRRATEGITA